MKLNLGCGHDKKKGWINVDNYEGCHPDIVHNLEKFPYPWEDNSIEEINMEHVLEHLGQTYDVYVGILKELYRICDNGAIIHIVVPHPRHRDFIGDPTHVRMITPEGLQLFDKEQNQHCIDNNYANSPLGIANDVNFKIIGVSYDLDDKYKQLVLSGRLPEAHAYELIDERLNVCKQISINLQVLK
jgi:hypothetical protein